MELETFDFDESHNAYFIVTTMRTGSTMFSNILGKNKLFKSTSPSNEHFHISKRDEHIDFLKNFTVVDLISKSLIQNKIFHHEKKEYISGVKLLAGQFHWLLNHKKIKEDEKIFLINNIKYIFLTRENKVLQAISLLRGIKESIWHKKTSMSYFDKLFSIVYSFKYKYSCFEIDEKINEINENEKEIKLFFKRNKIKYLTICYESVCKNPKKEIINVCRFLCFPIDKNYITIKSNYKKTSDIRSYFLEKKYKLFSKY